MARIAGIDLPKNKRGEIGLTYIYGIGRSTARYILDKASIDYDKKVNEWNDDEQTAIRNIITDEFKVEGQLRSEVQMSIKRLLDIACYRGLRHRKGLPVRGQRTRTNSRTRKENVKLLPVKRRHLRNNIMISAVYYNLLKGSIWINPDTLKAEVRVDSGFSYKQSVRQILKITY